MPAAIDSGVHCVPCAQAVHQLDLLMSAVPNFDAEMAQYRKLQRQVDDKCFTATPLNDCACLYVACSVTFRA